MGTYTLQLFICIITALLSPEFHSGFLRVPFISGCFLVCFEFGHLSAKDSTEHQEVQDLSIVRVKCSWDALAQASAYSVSLLLSQYLSLFDPQETKNNHHQTNQQNFTCRTASWSMEWMVIHAVWNTENLACPRVTRTSNTQTSQGRAHIWKGLCAGDGSDCPAISLLLCEAGLGSVLTILLTASTGSLPPRARVLGYPARPAGLHCQSCDTSLAWKFFLYCA